MQRLDPHRIRDAIAAAELRTSAEIVVTVAPFFLGRIDRAARRAFERLGVARTRGRNGVLLFVVPRRHRVFVLPDVIADARVDPRAWEIAARFIASGFRHGRATEGVVEAIAGLADALSHAFPPTLDDVNELADFSSV